MPPSAYTMDDLSREDLMKKCGELQQGMSQMSLKDLALQRRSMQQREEAIGAREAALAAELAVLRRREAEVIAREERLAHREATLSLQEQAFRKPGSPYSADLYQQKAASKPRDHYGVVPAPKAYAGHVPYRDVPNITPLAEVVERQASAEPAPAFPGAAIAASEVCEEPARCPVEADIAFKARQEPALPEAAGWAEAVPEAVEKQDPAEEESEAAGQVEVQPEASNEQEAHEAAAEPEVEVCAGPAWHSVTPEEDSKAHLPGRRRRHAYAEPSSCATTEVEQQELAETPAYAGTTSDDVENQGSSPEPAAAVELTREGCTPQPISTHEPPIEGHAPEAAAAYEPAREGTLLQPAASYEPAVEGHTPEPTASCELVAEGHVQKPVAAAPCEPEFQDIGQPFILPSLSLFSVESYVEPASQPTTAAEVPEDDGRPYVVAATLDYSQAMAYPHLQMSNSFYGEPEEEQEAILTGILQPHQFEYPVPQEQEPLPTGILSSHQCDDQVPQEPVPTGILNPHHFGSQAPQEQQPVPTGILNPQRLDHHLPQEQQPIPTGILTRHQFDHQAPQEPVPTGILVTHQRGESVPQEEQEAMWTGILHPHQFEYPVHEEPPRHDGEPAQQTLGSEPRGPEADVEERPVEQDEQEQAQEQEGGWPSEEAPTLQVLPLPEVQPLGTQQLSEPPLQQLLLSARAAAAAGPSQQHQEQQQPLAQQHVPEPPQGRPALAQQKTLPVPWVRAGDVRPQGEDGPEGPEEEVFQPESVDSQSQPHSEEDRPDEQAAETEEGGDDTVQPMPSQLVDHLHPPQQQQQQQQQQQHQHHHQLQAPPPPPKRLSGVGFGNASKLRAMFEKRTAEPRQQHLGVSGSVGSGDSLGGSSRSVGKLTSPFQAAAAPAPANAGPAAKVSLQELLRLDAERRAAADL